MKNQIKTSLIIVLLCFIVSSCGNSTKESQALTDFISEHKRDVQTLYFYPSTVRMLGDVMGAENNTAFADVESGRFVFTWDHERIDLAFYYDEILKEAGMEGFEMLAEMNTSDSRSLIYLNDQNKPVYLVLLQNSFGNFIVEIVGELSMKSITSLAQLDFKDVASTFGFSPLDEEANAEAETNEMLQEVD